MSTPLFSLHRQVWTALCAALIAVGAYLILPIGPVPVSMQPFFVMLAGFVLGPVYGAAAVLLYLVAGFIGLPVFSGGRTGLAHLFGPTGGYLIGFVAQAFLTGMANRKGRVSGVVRAALWGLAGLAAEYGLGMLWLAQKLHFDWFKTVSVGFIPFIPWDLLKLAVAVAAFRYMHKQRMLPGVVAGNGGDGA